MLENQCRLLLFSNKNVHYCISRLHWVRFCSNSLKEVSKPSEQQDKKEGTSILEAFSTKKNQFLELHRYNPLSVTTQGIKEWKDRKKREYEIFKQRYIDERHAILGSDLAAAHFIVYRGGKVKFHNSSDWIEMKEEEDDIKNLPKFYVRNMYLECIDASNTHLRYEGLKNFTNLNKLKWLSFRNCPYVDDWFLDKISGEYAKTLEYLDISDCHNVTENGLNGFYRFQKLKKLVVHNIVQTLSFEFRCFLLEDIIPGLIVEGGKCMNVK